MELKKFLTLAAFAASFGVAVAGEGSEQQTPESPAVSEQPAPEAPAEEGTK